MIAMVLNPNTFLHFVVHDKLLNPIRCITGLFGIALAALLVHTGATFLWLLIATGSLTVATLLQLTRSRPLFALWPHAAALFAIVLFGLNSLWSVHPELSFVTFWKLILGLWVCLLRSCCVSGIWNPLRITIIALTLCAAVWGIAQYLIFITRIAGPQYDVNTYAAIIYTGSLLWLQHTWCIEKRWSAWSVFGQFVLLFALMATFSRGGIASWMLGCCGFLLAGWSFKRSVKVVMIYLLIALIAYLAVKLIPVIAGKTLSRDFNDLGTLNARLPQWQAAWTLFKQHPWLGTGLGTFAILYPPLRTEFISAGKLAHNDYLQLLHEGGAVLFGCFILWIFWHLWCLWRIRGDQRTSSQIISYQHQLVALILINCVLFIHALINFIFYIDYLNIIAGTIFSRILWLAWRLRYIHALKKITLSSAVRLLAAMTVIVLWFRLLLLGGASLWFIEWNKERTVNSQLMSKETAQLIMTLDPLNTVATDHFFQHTYSALPWLSAPEQQALFDHIWQWVLIQQQRQSAVVKLDYWLALLSHQAVTLKLTQPPNSLDERGYLQQALRKHPGYFPAHLRLARLLEKEKGAEEALTHLFPVFLKWHGMESVIETYYLLGEMLRLAKITDAAQTADQIDQMRIQLRERINHPARFRPRYGG